MKAKHNLHINRELISEGTELRVLKVDKDGYTNSTKYLFEVVETGFKFWSDIRAIKGFPKIDPINWIYICLIDYINANWSIERMNKAGLIPKEVLPLLPQFFKYKSKLI